MSVNSNEQANTPTEGGAAIVLPPDPAGQSIATIKHNDDGSVTIFYTDKIEHTDDEHAWVLLGAGITEGQHHLTFRCACGAQQVENVTAEQYANPPHQHVFVCEGCGAKETDQ
jgi:hypothetical protein